MTGISGTYIPMTKLDLNERKQRLLMTLVERHIRDGQPVGSKTLASGSGLKVSPATIRNIMAELEDLGILASPHTSAGRIPTELGYRMYVDSYWLPVSWSARITSLKRSSPVAGAGQSPQELIAGFLTLAGRMAGWWRCRAGSDHSRQVGSLPLSASGAGGAGGEPLRGAEPHHSYDRDWRRTELRQAANYINHTHGGVTEYICDGLLNTMNANRRTRMR